MSKDIVPDLLERIKKDFKTGYKSNKKIKKALSKAKLKKATHTESNLYAEAVGDMLAKSFGKNISPDVLPDGKMHYNIASRILNYTLANNYDLISSYTSIAQRQLNMRARLNIKGVKPPLNQDRIDGLVEKLASEDKFEKVAWVLDEPIVNFSQSVVDDTIQENSRLHSELGLRPKIERKSTGDCCDWCDEVSGIYAYPDVPKDVFRRHQRCRCTIEYDPGDGKRQAVYTKKWIDPQKNDKVEKRKNSLKGESLKHPAKKERAPINYKIADDKIEKELQKQSDRIWDEKLLESEQNALYEYSNMEYGITNRYLRNATNEEDNIIFNQTEQRVKELDRVLSRNILGEDLVLYRGVNSKEFDSWVNSRTINTYKSSSISEEIFDDFGRGYKIIIRAPKNTKGFYLGDHSEFKEEKEFLLHRGQSYRILSNKNGILEVEING